MQNYKPNRLAPHGPPDASQTIALDKDLVQTAALLNKPINPTLDNRSQFNFKKTKNYPDHESNQGHYV